MGEDKRVLVWSNCDPLFVVSQCSEKNWICSKCRYPTTLTAGNDKTVEAGTSHGYNTNFGIVDHFLRIFI